MRPGASDDGPVTVRWVWAFVDLPAPGFEDGLAFWAAVARSTPSPRRGEHDQFTTLQPERGGAWVKVQRVGGAGGVHVDLDVDVPLPLARDQAVSLGACVVAELDDVVVCRSPGGLVFCLTRWEAEQTTRGQVRDEDSLVDQVCLDVPAAAWDVEVAFWSALTGWERTGRGCGCSGDDGSDAESEFGRLAWPEGLPVRFLLQHLDDQDGPVRAHLDLAAADREREVDRHVGLGATRAQDGRGWTVMSDPVGTVYCVTDRHPARARRT